MNDIWGNLLSGLIGGILGTCITSLVSYFIFKNQIIIDSNRIFLRNILSTLQHIFVLERAGRKIPDDDINSLIAFKIIAFDDFDIILNEIEAIEKAIIRYNEGVDKTLATTGTSQVVSIIFRTFCFSNPTIR